MARRLPFLHVLLFLLRLSAADTVTIKSAFDNGAHSCITECLYYGIFTNNMGDAMGCDSPYNNECYCATATASVSVADGWMSKCASSKCGRGDYTRDLSSMQSIYASYCMGAGFTQPGASKWYTPAKTTEAASSETSSDSSSNSENTSDAEPSKTADSGAAATTTQVTVITQTAEGGSVITKTQVVVHATSIVVVNSDGSRVGTGNSSNDNSSVKIGVGVGVSVAAILAGIFGFWFWRRRRRNTQGTQPSMEAGTSDTSTGPPMSVAAVARKPIGSSNVSPVSETISPVSSSKTNELSGEGVKREVDGQQVRPFVTPSPPVQFPGRYEVNGDTALRPEMDGLGQNPYAEVSGVARPPELPGHVQTPPPGYAQHEQLAPRWELPDNSRR